MRRRVPSCVLPLLVSTLATLVVPSSVQSELVLSQISPKLSVSGSLRLRGEYWGWFEPKGPQDHTYNFFGSVARGAVQWKDDAFDVFFEAQNSSLASLPDTAV